MENIRRNRVIEARNSFFFDEKSNGIFIAIGIYEIENVIYENKNWIFCIKIQAIHIRNEKNVGKSNIIFTEQMR